MSITPELNAASLSYSHTQLSSKKSKIFSFCVETKSPNPNIRTWTSSSVHLLKIYGSNADLSRDFALPLIETMPTSGKITLLLLFVWGLCICCNARVFTFTMHHRFSEPVKKWSETNAGKLSPVDRWPEKGSVEYYAQLADRDRFLRGRKLSDLDAPLAFSDGNSTFRISSLGLYVSSFWFF